MAGRRVFVCTFLFLVFQGQLFAQNQRLIVRLTPAASLDKVLAHFGGRVLDSVPEDGLYLIDSRQPVPFAKVSALPTTTLLPPLGIEWAEFNSFLTLLPMGQLGTVETTATIAPDWFKNQPAMRLIGSQAALEFSTGRGVVIADINSQVDYSHPALAGHLTSGFDFVSSKPDLDNGPPTPSTFFPDQSGSDFLDQSGTDFLDENGAELRGRDSLHGANPAYGHGTLCAAIIAVSAPDAMIMPLRAFDDLGRSSDFTLAKAIRYAVNHGAQIINMSFGTLTDSHVLRSAIEYAVSKHVILVAAAGNNNTSALQYPAGYPGVTAVSATDDQDIKSFFSNYGSYVRVDAPGVNIISAYPGNQYAIVSGTSFSSPIVAATAALVRSIRTVEVIPVILTTAVNINSKNPHFVGLLGIGRIDVLRSVQQQVDWFRKRR